MESVLGVTLSGASAEPIRDDILLCRLMNKLHPGMISEEVYTSTVSAFTMLPTKSLHICNQYLVECVMTMKIWQPMFILGSLLDSVVHCRKQALMNNNGSLNP